MGSIAGQEVFTPLNCFSFPLYSNKKTVLFLSPGDKQALWKQKKLLNTLQQEYHYPILFLFIYSSFIEYILTTASPPCTPPCSPNTSLPQTHCSSHSLQKRAGLPVISTEQCITRYDNTMHKLSCQGSTRHQLGGKGSHKQAKVLQIANLDTVQSPTKTPR